MSHKALSSKSPLVRPLYVYESLYKHKPGPHRQGKIAKLFPASEPLGVQRPSICAFLPGGPWPL
eukprot:5562747-Karenia_brevis.AAC.1